MWTKPWVHGVLVVIVTRSIHNQNCDEVRLKSSIRRTSQIRILKVLLRRPSGSMTMQRRPKSK